MEVDDDYDFFLNIMEKVQNLRSRINSVAHSGKVFLNFSLFLKHFLEL